MRNMHNVKHMINEDIERVIRIACMECTRTYSFDQRTRLIQVLRSHLRSLRVLPQREVL